jgi:hypothetical protein
MLKDMCRWIQRTFAACFHFVSCHLNELEKTINYITNIWNKSPRIPYYGQRFWPWNIFKWLSVFPFLRSVLCHGGSAVTSLEHKRTDITQHLLLALCEQPAAHTNARPHHHANTDWAIAVAVVLL